MMYKGQVQKQEYEYKRNGTTTLIAAFCVRSSKLIYQHLGPTRNEKDFVEFCQQTTNLLPKKDTKVFLLDQLNTHKSASLVEWVATEIEYKGDLGIKGKEGILKNMDSRMKFLEDCSHRIRFVFTPKHCSWLNPIENWFGKLQRQVLTGGVFASVEQLELQIRKYITYYNKCLVKPLNWKFKGFTKNKKIESYYSAYKFSA